MGVAGLWQLLQPAGVAIDFKKLSGKRLAVDISIWLQQIVKGMRDSRGEAVHKAHIVGMFSRVLRLLFYKIRPVFVFDGGTPALKQETVSKRRRRRNIGEEDMAKARERLWSNRLRKIALGDKAALAPTKVSFCYFMDVNLLTFTVENVLHFLTCLLSQS